MGVAAAAAETGSGVLTVHAAAAAAAVPIEVTVYSAAPPHVQPSSNFTSLDPPVIDLVKKFAAALPRFNGTSGAMLGKADTDKNAPFLARSCIFPTFAAKEVRMVGSARPDVTIHALRGLIIIAVRWCFISGDIGASIKCTCGTTLLGKGNGKRSAHWSTAGGTVRLVFRISGRPIILISWKYAPCGKCGANWNSLDPEILNQIEPRFLRQLPFDCAWAGKSGSLLFSTATTDAIVSDCVTYEPFSKFAEKMADGLALLYDRNRMDYHDHIAAWRREYPGTTMPFRPFPKLNAWIGRTKGAPTQALYSDAFLRFYYRKDGVHLSGKYMSHNIALACHMQQVECVDRAISLDHTFGSSNNANNPKVNMVYDGATEDYQVPLWAYTQTTASNEYVHMLEDLAHRPHTRPSSITVDDLPNGQEMYAAIFPGVNQQLDIWHVEHRITESLHKSHARFKEACGELSAGIWHFVDTYIQKCDAELLATNTFGGVKFNLMTPAKKRQKIQGMKSDKSYFEKYKSYLGKRTFDEAVLVVNLEAWIKKYRNCEDEKKKVLFTSATERTVRLQIEKVGLWSDPGRQTKLQRLKPNVDHNMQLVITCGSGKVEGIHLGGRLAANPGSRPELAHALTTVHFATHNTRRRDIIAYNEYNAEERRGSHLQPVLRAQANESAQVAEMPLPYPLEQELVDNGERFGYDAFKQQQTRGRGLQYPRKKMTNCPCDSCVLRRRSCLCPACARSRGVDKPEQTMAAAIRSHTGNRVPAIKKLLLACAKLTSQGCVLLAIERAKDADIDLVPFLSLTSLVASSSALASGGASSSSLASATGGALDARSDAGR